MTKNYEEPVYVAQKPKRRRVQFKSDDVSITDQEVMQDLTMASIKAKLERGIMPMNFTNNGFYSLDPIKCSNLQDVMNLHQQTVQRFESLPSEIRKDMGNNIHNFEDYVKNPANKEKLLKYKLIEPDALHHDPMPKLKPQNDPAPSPSEPPKNEQK